MGYIQMSGHRLVERLLEAQAHVSVLEGEWGALSKECQPRLYEATLGAAIAERDRARDQLLEHIRSLCSELTQVEELRKALERTMLERDEARERHISERVRRAKAEADLERLQLGQQWQAVVRRRLHELDKKLGEANHEFVRW